MRIETVRDLIEVLEQLPDGMPIMAQHQPSWPMREYIGGVWVDDGHDDEEEANTCDECGRVTLGDPYKDTFEGEPIWLRKCFNSNCNNEQECEPPMPSEEHIAYIVLNGHPYDGTPYGSKRAWSEI